MPFVVVSPKLCEAFPLNCPYCQAAHASTTVRQPYSKMALGRMPGQVQSETWRVELPACQDCASWFERSRLALFALGFSALLLPLPIIALDSESLLPGVWILSIVGWLGLLLWRRLRMQALRIAYIGPGEVVYAARSEAYARELATRNQLSYERRAVVVRLA